MQYKFLFLFLSLLLLNVISFSMSAATSFSFISLRFFNILNCFIILRFFLVFNYLSFILTLQATFLLKLFYWLICSVCQQLNAFIVKIIPFIFF